MQILLNFLSAIITIILTTFAICYSATLIIIALAIVRFKLKREN